MMLLILLLVSFLSFSAAASTETIECTEGLKARATLKFSECQDPLLPVKWCHELYRETLGWVHRRSYDRDFPNKTHQDEDCQTRKNMTSCEYLKHLTGECGGHYDACHTVHEKREIMRMWIKQFVRGTHELYWEFAFADNNQEILGGDCNDVLKDYFDDEEIDEILSLINTGPNTYEKRIDDFIDPPHNMLVSTKISNLTQTFGVLKDSAGNRIGYDDGGEFLSKPSNWQYCSWKMKHNIDEGGLFYALSSLMHCDGKCNTNKGDNQEWLLGSLSLAYVDIETGKTHYTYPDEELFMGDDSMFNCKRGAQFDMEYGAAENVDDLDKEKIELCKPFKTLLENCSIPISECIEDIAIREIVMAQFLKEMVLKTKRTMEIVERNTKPNFFGDFTYDDCAIFGGDVAGASFQSSGWIQIIVPFFLTWFKTFISV